MAAAAGKKANMVRVPRDRILEMGGSVLAEPAYFGTYFDLPPITENVTKVARVLSVKPTPFEQGLRETYRWYLRNGRRSRIDFSFEDKLLAFAQPEGGAGISLLRAD
jgi:hypothetical protein